MSRHVKLSPMIAVGQVIKHHMRGDTRLAKIRIQKMSLDKNLLMYFPKKVDKWSADLNSETKLGDIVMIRNLEQRIGVNILCKVDSVLYKVGEATDPITGRPCRGTEFLDVEERKKEQAMRDVQEITHIRMVEKDSID